MNTLISRRLFHVVAAVLTFSLTSWSMTVSAQEPDSQAPPAKMAEIITKVIDAYGVKDSPTKVSTIYTRGFSKLYNTDNDGWVTLYVRHPLMMRANFDYHVKPETRILNNMKGWVHVGAYAQQEANKAAIEALVFQYNYMRLPFELADLGKSVVCQGKDKVGSSPVDVVLVKNMNGMDLTLYIDETTHLVAKVSTTIGTGKDKRVVSVELLDYKAVDKIKVPFKIISSVGTTKVSDTTITKVVFNQEMADSLFKP